MKWTVFLAAALTLATPAGAAETWTCTFSKSVLRMPGHQTVRHVEQKYRVVIEGPQISLVPVHGDLINSFALVENTKARLVGKDIDSNDISDGGIVIDRRRASVRRTVKGRSSDVSLVYTGSCTKKLN